MNNYEQSRKLAIMAWGLAAALLCGFFQFSASAADAKDAVKTHKLKRILKIKNRVFTKGPVLRMEDFAINDNILNDTERNLEITDTPVGRDRSISIIDLAYMMQKYDELNDIRLRGPRFITLKKINDSKFLLKAKNEILETVKNTAPWKGWEIDLLFSSSDETIISRVGEYSKLEAKPYENKKMVGTVGFRVVFYDANGKEKTKIIINPVILRKVDVAVMHKSGQKGHLLKSEDVKCIPLWVGGNKKDYIFDLKECLGKELAKDLAGGDIIRSSDLLSPVCAHRGEMIWVACKKGPLTVKLAVQAMDSGRAGDIITVKNQTTQKTFEVELKNRKEAVFNML